MNLKTLVFSAFAVLMPLGVAQAACEGRDLLAQMPADERAALEARAHAAPHAQGLFFRATRGAEEIHMIGTLHLPDPRHAELLSRVTPALAAARQLLVEATPEQEARLKTEIAERPELMFLTQGPKLNKLLAEEEWKDLAARMQDHGVPPFFTARFRPWYLSVMLGMPPCATQGLRDGARGLDHQLIALAQERGLPIRPLEPFDTLFRIFGDLSLEEELDMVRATLKASADPEDGLATTVNGYFAAETRLIWEFTRAQALSGSGQTEAETEAQFALMEDVMVNRRNHDWIPVLTEAARQGPVFAAFGALHLPGEQGVLALLEAEGFEITRLD